MDDSTAVSDLCFLSESELAWVAQQALARGDAVAVAAGRREFNRRVQALIVSIDQGRAARGLPPRGARTLARRARADRMLSPSPCRLPRRSDDP